MPPPVYVMSCIGGFLVSEPSGEWRGGYIYRVITMKKIKICIGSSCFARGNAANVDVAEKFLKQRGLRDDVDVDLSGGLCTGNCADGPIVTVDGKIHTHVTRERMLEILKEIFP